MALHHVAAGEKVRLSSVASAEAESAALVKNDAFEAVQLVLRSGDTIAAHSVPGFATILCVEGSVRLDAERPVNLDAGEWVFLDRGERHSVSALEDSSLLVTILFE
jgi:quercetin dioxygenase-like cupin family protein